MKNNNVNSQAMDKENRRELQQAGLDRNEIIGVDNGRRFDSSVDSMMGA